MWTQDSLWCRFCWSKLKRFHTSGSTRCCWEHVPLCRLTLSKLTSRPENTIKTWNFASLLFLPLHRSYLSPKIVVADKMKYYGDLKYDCWSFMKKFYDTLNNFSHFINSLISSDEQNIFRVGLGRPSRLRLRSSSSSPWKCKNENFPHLPAHRTPLSSCGICGFPRKTNTQLEGI